MNLEPLNHHRAQGLDLDASMIPAINIVFLLLVFFMVAGQISASNPDVKVPLSQSEAPVSGTDTLIEIDAAGLMYLDHASEATHPATLTQVLKERSVRQLTVRVHRDLPAKHLDTVLTAARATGLQTIEMHTTRL